MEVELQKNNKMTGNKMSREMDGQYKSYGLKDLDWIPNHPLKHFAKVMIQLIPFQKVNEDVYPFSNTRYY